MENKKLKILLIGPGFPLRGGLAQFNEYLCKWFNRLGHQAEIISYKLQYPEFLFPGSTQWDQEGKAPEGISIHNIINSVNPFNWFTSANYIKKLKPDLVIIRFWLPFFGPCLGTIARLIKKGTNIKVIVLTDNIVPHEKRFGDTGFTKYFINACDAYLTMSKTVLEELKHFTSSSFVTLTPHPMFETYGDPVSKIEAREKLKLKQEDKIVLFFGLIRKYKGLDILLRSFAQEVLKNSKIKLLIAGEYYEDKQQYLDIIESHGLSNQVILHDHYISNEDVKYYFCASDLIAQSYRTATNSGVTMVAYYYNRPVLVTAVGGLPEIVPHLKAGYVVNIDEKEIANSIADYFSNNREAEFIEGVKEEKKKYEWNIFANKIIELYTKVVSEKK